jgi:hypothetical protein
MLQWGDFESKFDVCSQWLKHMEQQVKNYELKSTLDDKKTQVEKFKVHGPFITTCNVICPSAEFCTLVISKVKNNFVFILSSVFYFTETKRRDFISATRF